MHLYYLYINIKLYQQMNADNKFETMEFEAIEELYKQYKEAPENVEESFRFFFQGFELATSNFPIKPQVNGSLIDSNKELEVMRLITQYRRRSEEHTSELQSRPHLVCRLLLEKKKKKKKK